MTQSYRIVLSAAIIFLLSSCDSATSSPKSSDAVRNEIEAAYQSYRKDFPDVKEATPQEVLTLQEAGPTVLVDVRTPEEQAVSMLPGAITKDAFEAAQNVYRDQHIVAYCTIGARSGVYADTLRKKGLDVFNLKGGILAWTNADLPLIDNTGKETNRVHTYGRQWNLVGEGSESVW